MPNDTSFSSADHARVVVIGGGVIGCSLLYHLTKAGWDGLVLVEEAQLTSGSTWHAAANGSTVNASPLVSWCMKRTFELWREVEEESGQVVGAHNVGGLMIARTIERLDELHRLRGIGRRVGVDYEMLTSGALKKVLPFLNADTVLGGMYDPCGGHVDPYGLTQAFARAARQRGAAIRQGWKVTGLEQTTDGGWIVSGPQGQIKAEMIVNAAGLYADEVAKLTDARLPLVNMRHHYLLTEPIPEIESLPEEPPVFRDVDAGVYGRREGGGLLFGIYERDCRDFGADGMPESFISTLFDPDFERIAPELEHVFQAIPCIAETGIRSTVHGPFVFTPDGRPLIGWMPGQRNHFAAAGFLAGISMSGGFGQLMAEWIVDGAPHRDLASCDMLRFGDWAIGDFARARAHETYATRYKMHFPNEETRAGRPVRITPMHERYAAMGAHFGFADGWERPNWFAGPGQAPEETPTFRRSEAHAAVERECAAVHDAAGYMDLLSFANHLIAGPDAETFLRRVLPGRLPAKTGALALSPIVNAKGGLLGDATILRLDEQQFMLVASGAFSRIHLREWLPHLDGLDVTFTNRTDDWAGFMVAGPQAREIVTRLLGAAPPAFFRGAACVVAGVSTVVLRLSYVGELAYEIHCAMADQPPLHDALLAAAEDAGCPLPAFGARAINAMRIEKGLPRTGDELTIEATPFETGMDKLFDLDRNTPFIGQQALRALADQPLRYRMVSLRLDDTDIDPTGTEPVTSNGALAGYVSSAAYGHRVGAPVALAFMRPHVCQNGARVAVHILGREVPASVSLQPLFDPEGRRARS